MPPTIAYVVDKWIKAQSDGRKRETNVWFIESRKAPGIVELFTSIAIN